MKSEIKEIKEAVMRLNWKDRGLFLKWACHTLKDEKMDMEAYATEIWEAMAEGILKATRYIDIREKCRDHEYVLYRALVFYHMYTDWVEGASTIMIGKVAKLSHSTVTHHIKIIEEALSSDRNIKIWEEYHKANDKVVTIFNNYINQ